VTEYDRYPMLICPQCLPRYDLGEPATWDPRCLQMITHGKVCPNCGGSGNPTRHARIVLGAAMLAFGTLIAVVMYFSHAV
jgi:hypothetical protein